MDQNHQASEEDPQEVVEAVAEQKSWTMIMLLIVLLVTVIVGSYFIFHTKTLHHSRFL